MWNISYNYILENMKKKMTRSYAYADDTLILLMADTVPELYGKVSRTVEQVEKDTNQARLYLNVGKTKIMLMKKHGTVIAPPIKIKGTKLRPKGEFKYLGVWLDDRLSWEPHVRKVCEKGMKLIPKLAALARNTFGYSNSAKRVMLEGTIGAYMPYTCAVFAHRPKVKNITRYINRLHRVMLLCYGRLYRTVSYIPASVICD